MGQPNEEILLANTEGETVFAQTPEPELEVVETRKLASFRIVDALEPIDGADLIEVAVVDGWKVVVKKGEFHVGQPCVYFEIDTFLPDGNPAWQFLVDKSPRMFKGVKGHKLRTIKLRGQVSQGLVLPVDAFPVLTYLLNPAKIELVDQSIIEREYGPEQLAKLLELHKFHEHEAGLDPRDLNLNDILGVSKYEPPLSADLAGKALGFFPSFIRKTDQERAQNIPDSIFGYEDTIIPANPEYNRPETTRPAKGDRNARYEVTMKLDGSSMTVFVKGEQDELTSGVKIGICSRNLELKIDPENAGNTFINTMRACKLDEALVEFHSQTGRNIAVQGECMGPGIQENREGLTTHQFFVFDIFDIDKYQYVGPAERRGIIAALKRLGAIGIEHVPVLHESVTLDELGLTNMEELLAYAEGPSIKHAVREGLVYKRDDGQFSFKTISNKYLVKEKD